MFKKGRLIEKALLESRQEVRQKHDDRPSDRGPEVAPGATDNYHYEGSNNYSIPENTKWHAEFGNKEKTH